MIGIEGRVLKDRNDETWIVSFPSLDSKTEGNSKSEALQNGANLILAYLQCFFDNEMDEDFEVDIIEGKKGKIAVTATNYKLLISLLIIKQTEISIMKQKNSNYQISNHSKKTNKKYINGKFEPNLEELSEIIETVNPNEILCINTLKL